MLFWKKNQLKKCPKKDIVLKKKKRKRKEKEKERRRRRTVGLASTQPHQRLPTRVSPVTSPSRRGFHFASKLLPH
jgi:hypothetical protein